MTLLKKPRKVIILNGKSLVYKKLGRRLTLCLIYQANWSPVVLGVHVILGEIQIKWKNCFRVFERSRDRGYVMQTDGEIWKMKDSVNDFKVDHVSCSIHTYIYSIKLID